MFRNIRKFICLFLSAALIAVTVLPVYAENAENSAGMESAPGILKGGNLVIGWEEFNPEDTNIWLTDTSVQDKYVLLRYIGSAEKVYIPGEYKGKKVELDYNSSYDQMFYGSSVKSLKVGDGVKINNGRSVFMYATYLSDIEFEGVEFGAGCGGLFYKGGTGSTAFNTVLETVSIHNCVFDYDASATYEGLGYMFANCSALKSVRINGLKVLYKGREENTSLSYMFSSCSALKEVTLLGLDVSKVNDVSYMFASCSQLTTIYVDSNFVIDEAKIEANNAGGGYQEYVFYYDSSLEGGKGTLWSDTRMGYKYLKIDGGTGDPGYLTLSPDDPYLNYMKIRNSYNDFVYPTDGSYHIPESRYKSVFGRRGSFVYEMFDDPWGGSCYGFSATSGLFKVSNNGVNTSAYSGYGSRMGNFIINDGSHPLDTDFSDDKDEELNSDLRKFMEALQISQYDERIQACFVLNTDLNDAVKVIKSESEKGRPVLIGIFGKEGGHAVLAYGITKDGNGIEIYDINHPGEKKTITLTKEGNKYTKWSYTLGINADSETISWGSPSEAGDFAYVPYDVYSQVWMDNGSFRDEEWYSDGDDGEWTAADEAEYQQMIWSRIEENYYKSHPWNQDEDKAYTDNRLNDYGDLTAAEKQELEAIDHMDQDELLAEYEKIEKDWTDEMKNITRSG